MRAVCGLDVHKDSVFLCILCETGEIIERVFGVLTFQLRYMRRLMQSYGVSEVTMSGLNHRETKLRCILLLPRVSYLD